LEIFRLFGTVSINKAKAIGDLNAVNAKGSSVGNKLGKVFKTLGKVAVAAFAIIAAAGAAIFVGAIKKAAEFEKSMAMVQSVTGATAKQFEELEQKAKELGKTSKFSMTEIADGMEFLGRAGFETTEIISAMDGVVALASSQVMDLGAAADITSNILTGMGLDAAEAARVADVLAQTAASANVNVEMLGESFKYAAPLAAAAGWSIEETAAAIGKMGDAGIQASMAGTALRMALSELIGESDLFKDKLGALGMTMDELKNPDGSIMGMADVFGVFEEKGFGAKEMLDLFGKRAGPAMAILLQEGSDGLDEYTKSLEGAGGAAQRMADIQLDTLSGQLTILKGSFDLLLVTIGEDMMPILKNFLKNHIIPLVNGFTAWIEKMGGLRGVVGHMLIAIGNYIGAAADWIESNEFIRLSVEYVWAVLKELWSFVKNVFTGDWAAAWQDIKDVAVLALGFIHDMVVAAWEALPIPDAIKTKIENALTAIKDFAVKSFVWIKDKAVEAWDGIKSSAEDKADGVTSAWDGVKQAVGRLWDAIKKAFDFIIGKFDDAETSSVSFRDVIKGAFDVAIEIVIGLMDAFSGLINFVLDHKEAFAAALAVITTGFIAIKAVALVAYFGALLAKIPLLIAAMNPWVIAIMAVAAAAALIVEYWDVIVPFFTELWDDVTRITTNAWNSIGDFFDRIWDTIIGAFQAAIDWIRDIVPGFIQEWLGWGEESADSYADGIESGKDGVENAAGNVAGEAIEALAMTLDEAKTAGEDMVSAFAGALTSGESDAYDAGDSLGAFGGDGLINGVQGKFGELEDTGEEAIGSVFTGIENRGEIESPSKVAEGYGEDTGQGLIDGLRSMSADLIAAGQQMIDDALTPMETEGPERAEAAGEATGEAYGEAYETTTAEAIWAADERLAEAGEHSAGVITGSVVDTIYADAERMEAAGESIPDKIGDGVADATPDAIDEVKSLWDEVKDVVQTGTEETARIVGGFLDGLKRSLSSALGDIIKDVTSGEKTLVQSVTDGMAAMVSSIWNSGIDAAADWAVDQLWKIVFGAGDASSALSTAASAAGSAGAAATGAATGAGAAAGTGATGAAGIATGTIVQGVLSAAVPALLGFQSHEQIKKTDEAARNLLSPVLNFFDWLSGTGEYGKDDNTTYLGDGGVYNTPTMLPKRMVAEAGVSEAYIPLKPSVLAGIGQGIVSAMSPSMALAGGGGTINVDINFDKVYVRNDGDITAIAKETHDLWKSRMRGLGRNV